MANHDSVFFVIAVRCPGTKEVPSLFPPLMLSELKERLGKPYDDPFGPTLGDWVRSALEVEGSEVECPLCRGLAAALLAADGSEQTTGVWLCPKCEVAGRDGEQNWT